MANSGIPAKYGHEPIQLRLWHRPPRHAWATKVPALGPGTPASAVAAQLTPPPASGADADGHFCVPACGGCRHGAGLMACHHAVQALEHFQKYCSHAVRKNGKIGLFGFWLRFGSVTGRRGMLLRQSLAKTQKSSLRVATVFLQTLQPGPPNRWPLINFRLLVTIILRIRAG